MSIWNYNKLNDVNQEFRLTLGEGQTGLKQIEIKEIKLGLKLENENPNASFKDRSLAYQLSFYYQLGKKHFVISSSGNAAISAAAYCELMDAKLDIFVANRINQKKLSRLREFESTNIRIHLSEKAKSDAIKHANATGAINLRGSKDDAALHGFRTIAYELANQYPQIDSVFVPCSSGTSSLAIHQGFKELGMKVQLHICQTDRIHPMAAEFDTNFDKTRESLADAISDRVAPRRSEVIQAIKESHGFGWVLSDQRLKQAKDLLESDFSYNSLLSVAGILKAKQSGFTFENPVAIISGT